MSNENKTIPAHVENLAKKYEVSLVHYETIHGSTYYITVEGVSLKISKSDMVTASVRSSIPITHQKI